MRTLAVLVSAAVAACLLHAQTACAQASASPPAGSAGATVQQITTLMNQLQQARLKADAGFFQTYMTDDYVGIHGGDGATETKAQLVGSVKSGKLRYSAYDMRELTIRAYGDAAIANTLVVVDAMEASGKRSAGEFRTTWVWTRIDGGWRCAAFQATKVVR